MSQNDDLNHASILNLTAQEKTAYSYLFSLADSDSLNVVTGERAVAFFEKTSVPAPVLGEAWQIADTENRGLLTKPGFCMVLRLIGWYQNGQHSPSTELAFKPAPIPKFEGVTIPGVSSGTGNVAATASPTGGSFPQGALQPQLSGQNTGSTPVRVPPLDPTKVQQYSNLFNHSNTTNGFLDGGTAKSIFERAGLPNDVLGRIWMLSDREQRGALDETEFIIAMHLLTCMKMRTIPNLPNTLPQGLYDAAARRGQSPPSRQNTQQAAAVPRQLTGSGVGTVPRTQSPLARPPSSNYSAPTPQLQSAQPTGQNWLVTPQEKAQYDNHFNNIDTAGAGVLSGEQAVQFFSDSRLSEDTLASIWDLADINSEGQLNRDEFAVAMYLIRQQRSPNPPPLPAFLPAALVPPSMRGPQQVQQSPAFSQQQQQNAFDAPTPTPVKPATASDDLFGLDSSPTQPQFPQQQTLQPQGTGASATRDPFAGSAQGSPASPTRFQQQQTASGTFKPFIPTSAFGASLAAQNTGSSTTSQPQQQPRGPKAPMPSVMDDLLGDNDASAEESRGIGSDSTELANMSNQIGNLRTQMESTQSKKAATQAHLTATSNQKRDLEQRLQQFRAQYEAEVRTVKEMEQQLATSKASTKQLGQELAMLEGTHQDLQTQHKGISEALQADQQENANLKQRIAQINSEVSGLKPQIEKLKLDARQQKGLVSINKKQLTTNEAERDRMVSDKADLERAASASAASAAAEEQSRSLAASPEPAVGSGVASPPVASPAAAAASSTNPFFRSTSQGSASPPPPAAGPNPASFDAIFGPSNAFAPTGQTSSRSGTPPATSFIGRSVPDTSTSTSTAAAVGVGAAAVGAAAVGGVVAAITGGDSGSSSGQATPPPSSDVAKESPLTASDPPPPPPPESRQFTPTELPLGGGVVGAESDTASSTKVVPPASRAGGIETPRELASSPPSVLGSAGGATSAFSPPPPIAAAEEPEREVVPGAFPAEERRPSIIAQEVSSSNGPSTRDVTPLPQPKPADDFESAFASFGEGDKTREAASGTDPFAPTSSSQQGASKVSDAEFPPIQSLEQDDDSDSDSEDERGFDDDFTTASPPRNGLEGASGAVATPLPDATQQTSPPSYEQSAGSAAASGAAPGDSSSFPREFGSLLPAREDPTSPPPPPENQAVAGPPDEISPAPLPSETQSPSQTVESSSDTFVDASSRPLSSIPDATTITQTAAVPATSAPKNVFDEFDDFGELSEAREAGTTGNDLDFAFGRASQEEYNPTFDSPAASQTPTPLKSSVMPAPTQESNGFANFTPNTSTVGTSPFGGGTGSVQRTPQDVQHDWDTIFSGLDNSNNIDTSLGSGNVADANADEIWQPPPGPPPGRAPITTNGSSVPLAAPVPVPQSGTTTKGAPTGRAITPGTEHDDPILKRLTGMGYARADALNALEKYDYDINKAVDHLAGS